MKKIPYTCDPSCVELLPISLRIGNPNWGVVRFHIRQVEIARGNRFSEGDIVVAAAAFYSDGESCLMVKGARGIVKTVHITGPQENDDYYVNVQLKPNMAPVGRQPVLWIKWAKAVRYLRRAPYDNMFRWGDMVKAKCDFFGTHSTDSWIKKGWYGCVVKDEDERIQLKFDKYLEKFWAGRLEASVYLVMMEYVELQDDDEKQA